MAGSRIPSRFVTARITVGVVAALGWGGCARDQGEITAPGQQAPSFSAAGGQQPDLGPALAVHGRHTARLIAIPGVVGTAVGLTADGRPAVKVFTKAAGVAGLPENLEGVPVEAQVTGEFFAKPARASSPPEGAVTSCTPSTCTNTGVWPFPVPIGVSTSTNAFLQGFCFAGTIAARVKSGATVYALSNNHVYALENTVSLGTAALQPGLADTQCSPTGSNKIGTLSAFAPIAFCARKSCASNTIDAAIAVSDATKLDNKTPPAGYGTPSPVTVPGAVGLSVKKYGRTTSLTTGSITGIDASVLVGYLTGTALFVHQVVVSSCPTTCIGPGDSGSLLVTNDASANPVGLLFAGNSSGSTAIANRIGDVLTYFGVTIDGSQAVPPPPVATFTFSCTGLVCTFDGSSSTGSGLSYAWTFGDNTSGTGVRATHTYLGAGSYVVTLTVTDNATPPRSNSTSKTVTVTAPGGDDQQGQH